MHLIVKIIKTQVVYNCCYQQFKRKMIKNLFLKYYVAIGKNKPKKTKQNNLFTLWLQTWFNSTRFKPLPCRKHDFKLLNEWICLLSNEVTELWLKIPHLFLPISPISNHFLQIPKWQRLGGICKRDGSLGANLIERSSSQRILIYKMDDLIFLRNRKCDGKGQTGRFRSPKGGEELRGRFLVGGSGHLAQICVGKARVIYFSRGFEH